MEAYTLIRKIHKDCPLCDKVHEIEERKRMASTIIKGEEVAYEERFFFCANANEEEHEFETGSMANENLLNARNAYRVKNHLLTSREIIEIRESYGLSQVDLAKLLGWGEATISRYESKAIQDEAYDTMLRIIKDSPLKALEFLKKNGDKFPGSKRNDIREKMVEKLDSYGKEFLTRQAMEGEYANYNELSDANGYTLLDIDKIECIISYFAEQVTNLYKVKLMKMLWYADVLFYQQSGKSMTGLVYRHDAMGALPIGHYSLMNLEHLNIQEEAGVSYDAVMYHIYPSEHVNKTRISDVEKKVLDAVIVKFKNFKAQEIVEYMHKERAYIETNSGEIIPFGLAKKIRAF